MNPLTLLLFLIIPSVAYGQSDSTILRNMRDGAYDTYQNFIFEKPTMQGEALVQLIGRNSDGNQIILPSKDFGDFFGLILNGQFYVNYKNETKKMIFNNYAILAASVATNTLNPNDRIFARVLKFGKIGLTSLNSCFKMPSRINNPIFVGQIKDYLKDDKELYSAFKKSRNKETEMYRFIDLYNKAHPVFKIGN